MKKLFYLGAVGLILFEMGNVYFIMPLPGSQEMNSIDIAYFLHTWRWIFRSLFTVTLFLGLKNALTANKVFPTILLVGIAVVAYFTNFKMAADVMFYQPSTLQLRAVGESEIADDKLVIGIAHNGQAKAYPIQFLGYHHQVRDSIGGKPVMITYCTVCRTGRVFEPVVNGKAEEFRLVGMDHFNAMFEDKTTKSWWQQATGEAVAGKLKGSMLVEFPSYQTTLKKWKELHPYTWVMQADPKFQVEYDSMKTYEKGRLTGKLTRRDTSSWQAKSWVVGVEVGQESKAYDWNSLQKEKIIYDELGNQPIVIILSQDGSSFIALQRTDKMQKFTIQNDTLVSQENLYNFLGKSLNPSFPDLKKLNAYQEYWHSWQTFHPKTKR
ncbi:DUF3179 domain-containing (seleno)protein [Thermoflexibacter ruber]|uniref:DUF3179 domain-containing protein n=1 Tax=Thermoflexibacter ruber TaxID=1003 RepID=A0A1I2FSH1_9BACT|nr:DUF3179 domain-containing (seleno)protein [Thermoflexibacter ruber]SFF07943.1 Protein of unknown function [Thermoflexibacter ruber]